MRKESVVIVVLWFLAYVALVVLLAVWRARHDAARKKHRHRRGADLGRSHH